MRGSLLVCSAVWLVAQVSGAPNIVVIIADDLGWNDVSFHGSSQILTPNIDALAYQGVILNRHYTQPTCSPSRAAFLTGRYPVHSGMQMPISAGSVSALSLNFTLLPQHLQKLGYQTHLVGKWHLGSHRSEYLPTNRGFHSHFGFWNGFQGYFDGIHLDNGVAGIDARRGTSGAWEEFVGQYATDVYSKEAESIIKKHDVKTGPLYLQLALSAPHTGNKGSEFEIRNPEVNEEQHGHIGDVHRRLYAGMVRGVDDAVGSVLEALKSRDMLNNTIVLFTSDNGAPTLDPFWGFHNWGSNWPLRGMKISCHEGGVRTVAALWSPLVEGGRVSEQLIHISDWMPTLYSAAGGKVRDLGPIDGVDQWEELSREQNNPGKRTEILVDLSTITGNEAVIKWPWKLIKYSTDLVINTHAGESGRGPQVPEYSVVEVTSSPAAHALAMSPDKDLLLLRKQASIDSRCPLVVKNETKATPCVQRFCLFNLLSDPCETTDVSLSYPATVIDLQHLLEKYQQSMVPATNFQRDPRSHPSHYQNYWAPWADGTASEAVLCTPWTSLCTACLLIVLWSFVKI